MWGSQQLLRNSELAPQIIGAHQPHKLVLVYCLESTVTPGWNWAQQLGQLSHTVRSLQPTDCGSLFNFWIWSGGGRKSISLGTRLHGICNASHKRMEEGAHLRHLSYRSAPVLGLAIKDPPCFRVLFGNIQQWWVRMRS